MTQKIIFSNDQKEDISKKYLSDKMTIKKISLVYNVSETPIKHVLRELNIKTREPNETSRKYTIDETYFNAIDTSEKAYFLGLLFADGYNSGGSITFVLIKKDRHILEKFVECLKTNKPVKDYPARAVNWNDTSRIQICNTRISQQLTKLGCMPAKSFQIKFPEYLDKDLIKPFIRGYFDGDGCFSYCYSVRDNYFGNSLLSVITFTSTEDFCLYLKKYFKDNFDINTTMLCRNPDHDNNNRTLQISGNKQVIEIMNWMYYDTDLYFQRKHNKFIKFCEIRKERLAIVSKLRSENGKKVMDRVNKMIKERKDNKIIKETEGACI